MSGGNGKTARFQVTEDHFLELEDCETEEDCREFLITYGSDIWNQAIEAAANKVVSVHPRWGLNASREVMKLRG